MDQGHFLTDSGSKIPVPKSAKETLRIPSKPVLGMSTVKTTAILPESAKASTSNLVRAKATVGRSVPELAKPTLTRSKTNINKPPSQPFRSARATPATATKQAVKRPAPPPEEAESTVSKVPKTGFPYKAKSWELKLRIAECEQWVIESRARIEDLEAEKESNAADLQDLAVIRAKLTEQTNRADSLQERLSEKTVSYDKLHTDSKTFLDKIQYLELDVAKKQQEQILLQGDLMKLREEALANSSEISKLKFSLDDLEFKFKRQKHTLEDVENSYNQSKSECMSLQGKLRERDAALADTQEKLDRSERDCKSKANTISELEIELDKARTKIYELEKIVSSTKNSNENLTSELEATKAEVADGKKQIAELTAQGEDMRTKLCDSEKFRRFLHNQVQDLKGNIRVFCRVRPPLASEKENCLMCTINYPDEATIEVSKADPFENSNSQVATRPKFQKYEYSFDRVFNPSATQAIVFDELMQLVQSALDGYNVCIFAYGQTGSGKTYTMEGPNTPESRGMIPRTVEHIFKAVAVLEQIGWVYTVEVCFIEIYNEIIRDLLRNDKEGSNLKIMQVDGKTNDVVIPGLTVMKVNSYEDLDRLYVLAHQNRAVASTTYNEHSSRSHSVTKIKVTGVHKERGETCYGSLNLVDLAGSERLSESTAASDPRLREMKNINKSLSELGNVILGLHQKNEHIPYRNSKLTHLLQPALGGSSKTLMLVNISPIETNMSETLCSLRFAQKVNQVKVATSKKRIQYDGPASLK